MRNFYIDYENVHSAGLQEIDRLEKNDSVYIFYSVNAESVKMPIVKAARETKAHLEFIECETGKLNALDFQLLAFLILNLNKKFENYIISNDTGFDSALKIVKKKGFKIKRSPGILFVISGEESNNGMDVSNESNQVNVLDLPSISILHNPSNDLEKQILNVVTEKCGQKIKDEYGEIVLSGMKKCNNLMEFYEYLRDKIGLSEGADLYRALKGEFKRMRSFVCNCG